MRYHFSSKILLSDFQITFYLKLVHGSAIKSLHLKALHCAAIKRKKALDQEYLALESLNLVSKFERFGTLRWFISDQTRSWGPGPIYVCGQRRLEPLLRHVASPLSQTEIQTRQHLFILYVRNISSDLVGTYSSAIPSCLD